MTQWYYEQDGQQRGPVTEGEMRALLRNGEVLPGSLVWREGMEGWRPAAETELRNQPVEHAIPMEYAEPRTSGWAIASLVLGLLGLCCGCMSGIPGIACGHFALYQIRKEPHLYGGKNIAIAGLIISYLTTLANIGFSVWSGGSFIQYIPFEALGGGRL